MRRAPPLPHAALPVLLLGCSQKFASSADTDQDAPTTDLSAYGPENDWWHADASAVPPGLAGTGWEAGHTAYDFAMVDQNGDSVQLYQFFGQVIVLDLFAQWSDTCKQMASMGQFLWQDHEDEGFVFISVMLEDDGGGYPSQDDLGAWAASFALTHPVVIDSGGQQDSYVVGGYPTFVLIDRDMTIADADLWPLDETQITDLLQ